MSKAWDYDHIKATRERIAKNERAAALLALRVHCVS